MKVSCHGWVEAEYVSSRILGVGRKEKIYTGYGGIHYLSLQDILYASTFNQWSPLSVLPINWMRMEYPSIDFRQ